MKVNTIPGAAYALTCTAACSVQAVLSDASYLTVLETENSGQYIFVAPTDAVEVSDEHALVTQTFKAAALGLAAQGGIRLGEDAVLKNLTAEASTFSGTVNANGGINAVSTLAAGVAKTGLNAGSHAVMSVLGNVYHLDHANGTVTALEGNGVKMERALAGWCGLSWADTPTAHKCVLVKSAVTNTNYGGAISPAGRESYALVMSLLSGVNLAATQTKFGWTGYSGTVTATTVEDIPGPLFYVDADSRKIVATSGDGQVVTELSWAALSLDWVSRLDLIAVPASSGTCSIYLARHTGVSSGHGNHYNFNRRHLNPQVYYLGEVSLGLVSNDVHYAIIDTCSAERAMFRVSVIQGINPADYLNIENI